MVPDERRQRKWRWVDGRIMMAVDTLDTAAAHKQTVFTFGWLSSWL